MAYRLGSDIHEMLAPKVGLRGLEQSESTTSPPDTCRYVITFLEGRVDKKRGNPHLPLSPSQNNLSS